MHYYHLKLALTDDRILKILNETNIQNLKENYLEPHFRGEDYFIDGEDCNKSLVSKITITKSQDNSLECVNIFKKEADVTFEDELECVFDNRMFSIDITTEICQELKERTSKENEWLVSQLNNLKNKLDYRLKLNLVGIKIVLLTFLLSYVWLIFYLYNTYREDLERKEPLVSLIATLIAPVLLALFPIIMGRNFNYIDEWNSFKKKVKIKIYKKNNFDQKQYEKFLERTSEGI
ncbi:hypothetical protein MTsPCn5_28830 [Croceitalea sp. MTPC5]|uniref:hypothetical protein n=1 Tax=Croceitalea sp. MTPC5 TaxID=3056565 RepID=UPI002B385732|nr:hypothetical protein MTsPCn5_28830 [Croceitalea sp. MTPC5]